MEMFVFSLMHLNGKTRDKLYRKCLVPPSRLDVGFGRIRDVYDLVGSDYFSLCG
jgi:hypothetical protein